MVISGAWENHLPPALRLLTAPRALWFPKPQGLPHSLCPQVISMVMVAVGVYARLMKHAGELEDPNLHLPMTLAKPLPLLPP